MTKEAPASDDEDVSQMAIVVVSGSGRGVGKTALVCGLIAALPEFQWTAVKITNHEHGKPEMVFEDLEAGQGTDTGRYLSAGARRAFLVTAESESVGTILNGLLASRAPDESFIFESNRVLAHLAPDICLTIQAEPAAELKPSYGQVLEHADAFVRQAELDFVLARSDDEKPVFQLAAFEKISPYMLRWLHRRLHTALL
jgi:molybdopterin-guanine dinucleotide biosynthesis protein